MITSKRTAMVHPRLHKLPWALSKTFRSVVLSGAPQNRGHKDMDWREVEGSREYFRLKCRIKAFLRRIEASSVARGTSLLI